MTNYGLHTSKEISPLAKRKRVLAAVAQDIVTSEDDDDVADGMNICDIIENHTLQHKEGATSYALQAMGEAIRNTLLEINDIREQNRERRHKELLEVLTKMSKHESADSGKREMVKTAQHSVNSANEENANHDVIDEIVTDKQTSKNSNAKAESKNSIPILRPQELKQMPENTSPIVETANRSTNSSVVHIVTTKNLIRNSPVIVGKAQVNAVKSVFAVKQDSKEDIQKLRAEMFEIQRKKMEDRERKKREMQQRLQSND